MEQETENEGKEKTGNEESRTDAKHRRNKWLRGIDRHAGGRERRVVRRFGIIIMGAGACRASAKTR